MTRKTPTPPEAGTGPVSTEAGETAPIDVPEQARADLLFAALDAVGELVLVRDARGKVSYVNAAFLAAFGGQRSDWVGRWFSVAPPALEDGARRYDMLMRTRKGPVWIEWDERLLPAGEGVITVGRDVSARREAHASMEASQKAKSLFFAAVTHELRTPLAGAKGMAGLLEATPLRPDQADYVRSMAASTEHALAMVDDILDLSRLEAGKLVLRPERTDIAALVCETVELVAPRAHEKGLEIAVVQAAGAPREIEADASRLKQILFNLIGNAVKFTHEGGVRIDLDNNPGSDGEPRLTLSVTDSGPGISQTDQKSLFEHFERGAAERDGAESGAGLGLAMVRRLVEAMESSVGVESQPGQGARFWVTFELPVFGAASAGELAGREMAIASPNPILRSAMGAQLRALGADVVEIDRSDRLVAAAGRELLLDRAWQAEAGSVRAAHAWLLVTPAEKDSVISDLPDGVDGWLVKPVRRSSLVEQVTGRAAIAPAPAEPEGLESAEAEMPATLDGLAVLIAEDDPVNALIARRTLEKRGARVTVVESGTAALQLLEEGGHDAALLDQRMPGMDGPTVARMARLAGVALPLIALTANSSEADRQVCLEAGMNEFLTKPVDPDDLFVTLARLCADQNRASMQG